MVNTVRPNANATPTKSLRSSVSTNYTAELQRRSADGGPLSRYDGVEVWLEPVSSSASRTPNIDDHSHGAVHGNLEGMQHTLSRPDGRHVFDLDSKGTDLIVEKKQSSVHAKLFSKFLGRKSPAPRS